MVAPLSTLVVFGVTLSVSVAETGATNTGASGLAADGSRASTPCAGCGFASSAAARVASALAGAASAAMGVAMGDINSRKESRPEVKTLKEVEEGRGNRGLIMYSPSS